MSPREIVEQIRSAVKGNNRQVIVTYTNLNSVKIEGKSDQESAIGEGEDVNGAIIDFNKKLLASRHKA